LESLNKYKKEIELFGLLMKSPELFSENKDTYDETNLTLKTNLSNKNKNAAEKTIDELKKNKKDKLFSRFGQNFKT